MKKYLFAIALLVIVILGGCKAATEAEQTEPSETSPTEESTTVPTAEPLTEAQILFNQIKVGMTYEEVTELLGPEDADVGSGVCLCRYVITDEEWIYITYHNDYKKPGAPVCVINAIFTTPETRLPIDR